MIWQDIARRQHGVITVAQLRAIGLSRHEIAHLQAEGHLTMDRTRRVLRAGPVFATSLTAAWSAVLAARGTLSHLSAAAAWGIDVPDDGRVHVTVAERRRTEMPAGVRVHRVLLPADATVERDGLPITDRQRTVLDCAGLLRRGEAVTLFDRARQQKWISAASVRRRLIEEPKRRGNTQLRWLLESSLECEAESERRLCALLRATGITGWASQVPIAGYVADVAFAEQRIVIEVDGWGSHSNVVRFQSDRRRQNAIVNAGWTVLRFTWLDIVEAPGRVIDTVRQA